MQDRIHRAIRGVSEGEVPSKTIGRTRAAGRLARRQTWLKRGPSPHVGDDLAEEQY